MTNDDIFVISNDIKYSYSKSYLLNTNIFQLNLKQKISNISSNVDVLFDNGHDNFIIRCYYKENLTLNNNDQYRFET